MTMRKLIGVLALLLAIPVGSTIMAANPFAAGEATTFTDVQIDDDLYVTDDATVDGDIGVVGITATGTISAEQLTSTDDATISDDLGVTGDYTSTAGNITLTNGTVSAEQLTSTDDATITDLVTAGRLKVDATNGATVTGIYVGQGTINSGASSGVITVTGAAANDIAVATSITTGIGQAIHAAVAGTDQVTVTLGGNASTTSTIDVVVYGR